MLGIPGLLFAALLTAGCGAGPMRTPVQTQSGNTSVTVVASGVANDQLSKFLVEISSISLIDASGKTVPLSTIPISIDFIRINGLAEPFVTATVPQGVYTSASISVDDGTFTYVCLNPSTGGLVESQSAVGQIAASNVSISLPAPLTISGPSMVLSLKMLVSQSASFLPCDRNGDNSYSITPTFTLSPMTLSASSTNSTGGKVAGLLGSVASIDGNGSGFVADDITAYFREPTTNGPSWHVHTGPATVYQGIQGVSQLASGMPLDMDAEIQDDGSLLATRIGTYNQNIDNLTVSQGPLTYKNEYETFLSHFGEVGQGPLFGLNLADFDFNNATFQASGQFANIQNLPFTAKFAASSAVAGQNVLVSTNSLSDPGVFPYIQASTFTLLPQTINGSVSAVSNEGGFTIYTVALAAYDLFPALAVQGGQATVLTNPGTVAVYVDHNTQLLNTTPIAVGGVLRFNGLVFNDNGTLRMDCAQINDGVAE